VRRSTPVLLAGAVIVLAGGAITAAPWLEAYRWWNSPAAVEAERNAAAPRVVPVRAAATPLPKRLDAPPVAVAQPTDASRSDSAAPTLVPTVAPRVSAPRLADPVSEATSTPETDVSVVATDVGVVATPTLPPPDLRLSDVAFQFIDPPRPGATAVLSITVDNPTDAPGGPVSIDVPTTWLNGYRIEGVVPLPVDGTLAGKSIGNNLRLTVDGPAGGGSLDIQVYVVTTDEVVDAPAVRVVDGLGRELGHAQPPTEAPPSEPGPAYSVDIPNLHLHAGVVQVDWDPPLFVVGQLRTSAHVMQGNTVLIGHVRGAAGYNVFDHLDQVSVGEPIVANSRGQAYDFVVTQTEVLPSDDLSPTLPTSTPRLTLMTCTGDFNPLTREYADRLWVVAEPVVQAAAPMPTVTASQPLSGVGATDADLARAFGGPVGETRSGLAVYRRDGAEHLAQLADDAATAERRAALVVERARAGASLTLDDARRRARALLPADAQPRSATLDGNGRYAVEYFASATLAHALPPEWFAARGAQPGELIVVYQRQPDGRVSATLVGVGNDPDAMLALLD
jgi:LPXTG-site transpeptidase (sortase) family protein